MDGLAVSLVSSVNEIYLSVLDFMEDGSIFSYQNHLQ